MNELPSSPFEPDREIGTVIEVQPTQVTVNLPRAAAPSQRRFGHRVPGGEVGEHVLIDVGEVALLGRITRVRLPERDRLSVEGNASSTAVPHPIGVIQPLSTIDLNTATHVIGISKYPRLGDRVYSAHPAFLSWMVSVDTSVHPSAMAILLGSLAGAEEVSVRVSPEVLFGRHCAILGSTGAGKSWTAARLVEELKRLGIRTMLIDATGEYHRLAGESVLHLSMGVRTDRPDGAHQVSLPYHALHEMDLFALLKPAPGAQAPRLREAIRSLRLAHALGENHPLVTNGCIPKAERQRAPFETAMREQVSVVVDPIGPFDFTKLSEQVQHECVWPTARSGTAAFGGAHQQDLGYCSSLIMRIDAAMSSTELSPVFDPQTRNVLFETLDRFLASDRYNLLRLSLKHVPASQDAREVVVNAIGRHLLRHARDGRFASEPLIVVVDEAHNFLEHSIGDEMGPFPLDSFELIAKEGRKYGLLLCLATQRARDLPEGVVSQIGTFLVHRVANDRDRDLLERSGSDLERDALGALPLLTPGELVGTGVGFPIPLRILMAAPDARPDSAGPQFASAS
jgi:hypothetical protein